MEHIESSIKVYFTTDYTIFKAIKGNRLLNEKKIKKIIADIKSGFDMLRYYPIVVDENMNVIDGQHRLYISRKLKQNVYYIISKKITLNEIAKVNSNTEKWKADDFINCYIQNGNKDYEALRKFKDEFKFPLSVCLMLLSTGSALKDGGSENSKDDFQQGKFTIHHKEKAYNIANTVKKFSLFPQHKSRTFIVAICKILEAKKVKIEEIITKYNEQDSSVLKTQGNYKGYLTNLEEIYNYRCNKRKVIF